MFEAKEHGMGEIAHRRATPLEFGEMGFCRDGWRVILISGLLLFVGFWDFN